MKHESKPHYSVPFSLDFSGGRNPLIIEQDSNVLYQTDYPYQYEILLEITLEKFLRIVGSASKLYRLMSNSNQTTGYIQNRKWWSKYFIGGEYYTYQTDDKIYIHYKLELTDKDKLPSELQIKWRFAKAMRGLRFEVSLGLPNHSGTQKLTQVQEYLTEHRYIGLWYKHQHQTQ
jgi:hypothetical protein